MVKTLINKLDGTKSTTAKVELSICKQQFDTLTASRLSYGSCRLILTETAGDIHSQDESVDRRNFFKSFGKAFLYSAKTVLSATNNKTERQTAYAEKQAPEHRKLLNQSRSKLPKVLQGYLGKLLDSHVSFNESCSVLPLVKDALTFVPPVRCKDLAEDRAR